MNDVPEDEARALLASPLFCDDCGQWRPPKGSKNIHETSCGLLDENGINVRLIVQLIFKRSVKTGLVSFQFSVFRRNPSGLERVYQLDVRGWPRGAPSNHHRPHEHFGDSRAIGNAAWEKWTYDEVMAYFCAATNIVFRPPVPHPEEFQLRRQ